MNDSFFAFLTVDLQIDPLKVEQIIKWCEDQHVHIPKLLEIDAENIKFNSALGVIGMDNYYCMAVGDIRSKGMQNYLTRHEYPQLWTRINRDFLQTVLDSTKSDSLLFKTIPEHPMIIKEPNHLLSNSTEIWIIANMVDEYREENSEVNGKGCQHKEVDK
jgi:hypothetical protein